MTKPKGGGGVKRAENSPTSPLVILASLPVSPILYFVRVFALN